MSAEQEWLESQIRALRNRMSGGCSTTNDSDTTFQQSCVTSLFLIYFLVDSIAGEIRYIGKSTTGMKRPRDHWRPYKLKKDRTHKGNWIRQLIASNKVPYIIIQEYLSSDDLGSIEKAWIALARMLGCSLTNATDGGEGIPGFRHSPEAKQKMSVATKKRPPTKGFLGHKHSLESRVKTSRALKYKLAIVKRTISPEHIEKIRQAHLGRKLSTEVRYKMSQSHIGKKPAPMSPEGKAAMIAALTGRKNGPLSAGHKEKLRIANTGKKHSLETRVKLSFLAKNRPVPILSDETRSIIAAKLKGRKPSPQTIAASIAARKGKRLSLETRAKMASAHKGKKHTSEAKAKISATRRERAHLYDNNKRKRGVDGKWM